MLVLTLKLSFVFGAVCVANKVSVKMLLVEAPLLSSLYSLDYFSAHR